MPVSPARGFAALITFACKDAATELTVTRGRVKEGVSKPELPLLDSPPIPVYLTFKHHTHLCTQAGRTEKILGRGAKLRVGEVSRRFARTGERWISPAGYDSKACEKSIPGVVVGREIGEPYVDVTRRLDDNPVTAVRSGHHLELEMAGIGVAQEVLPAVVCTRSVGGEHQPKDQPQRRSLPLCCVIRVSPCDRWENAGDPPSSTAGGSG